MQLPARGDLSLVLLLSLFKNGLLPFFRPTSSFLLLSTSLDFLVAFSSFLLRLAGSSNFFGTLLESRTFRSPLFLPRFVVVCNSLSWRVKAESFLLKSRELTFVARKQPLQSRSNCFEFASCRLRLSSTAVL